MSEGGGGGGGGDAFNQLKMYQQSQMGGTEGKGLLGLPFFKDINLADTHKLEGLSPIAFMNQPMAVIQGKIGDRSLLARILKALGLSELSKSVEQGLKGAHQDQMAYQGGPSAARSEQHELGNGFKPIATPDMGGGGGHSLG